MRICEITCFFSYATSLNQVKSRITIIEKYAFANCSRLEEVRFPSCLYEICEGAFKQCINLKKLSFPSDSRLRIIGIKAFFRSLVLSPIEFPPHLEFIGDSSFEGCEKVKMYDLRGTQARHVGRINYCDCTFNFPPTVILGDVLKLSEE